MFQTLREIKFTDTDQLFQETFFTHLSDGWNQVHKRSNTLIKWLWKFGSELMAQGEKVVCNIHTVVVV